MKPTICGDNAIYVPSQEPCTDCERFEHRLDEAEEDIVAVGQEVNALNTYLNNRIDNIIAGPAPSAEEIVDARLGADGVTYPSLGDAVRGQVSDLKSDIDYDGEKYYPQNNLLAFQYLKPTSTPTNGEIITDDDCNVLHLTNAGSSAYAYFDLNESLQTGDTLYMRLKAKASANPLQVRVIGLAGSSLVTLKSFTVNDSWSVFEDSITIPDDFSTTGLTRIRIQLSNVGEAWVTQLILSKSAINYDYSIKSKLERIEPIVDNLNGNITIEEFGTDLKEVFSYKWEALPLSFESGYIAIDGTLTPSSSNKHLTYNVNAGERYKITTRHGSALRAYVLMDVNNNVVDYYPRNSVSTVTDTVELSIPINGILYVNTFRTTGTSVLKSLGVVVNSSGEGLAGKTWFALGDSITAYATGYHTVIAEETGAQVTNGGVSGSGYMKPINNQTFVDRANLSEVYDIVTVFGSVNDMEYVADYLGTESDTETTTLGGCFNTLIDNLYASGNYHIGIISPIPQGTSSGNPSNTTGSFAQYTELLEKVCRRRGVPYLDLWHCSNMQPWDATFASEYMQDNTHPNTDGHKIFAPRIKAFIESL